MSAHDYFESIAAMRARVESLKQQVAEAYSAAGPHGQQMGSIGGGAHDPLAGIDRIIDGDLVRELERTEGTLLSRMDFATVVLYGRSGRGGVSRLTCTDDADMLCFHYLQGESWASIARRFDPDTSNLTVWCQNRARTIFREIDRVGMRALADT